MQKGARKVGVLCGAAFASALMAVTGATQANAASSTLIIGGIYTPDLSNAIMSRVLGGRFAGEELVSVSWPAEARPFTGLFSDTLSQSVRVGIESLTNQLELALGRLEKGADGNYLPGEKVTVVGLSAGNLVVDEVMRDLDEEADPTARSALEFYTVEDTTRQQTRSYYNPIVGYTFSPPAQTKWNLTVVTGEYDGFADFPDRWWNLISVANAVVGEIFVHVPVMFKALNPADIVDVFEDPEGGTTTRYFVPATTLPLVRVFPLLRPFQPLLRRIVDAGYYRNDPDPDTNGSAENSSTARNATRAEIPAADAVDGPVAQPRSAPSRPAAPVATEPTTPTPPTTPATDGTGDTDAIDTALAEEEPVVEASDDAAAAPEVADPSPAAGKKTAAGDSDATTSSKAKGERREHRDAS
ncbi:PE-PPE domain-containing protein [Mycolicibacterium vaccae]|uniref:PE-PPE domain-containing protein n=1 Tax=Mycolicibacterium vaccae TaxID=1810 RepID=UPI003D000794